MKHILLYILAIFVLASCTDSKYHVVATNLNNEVILDTVIVRSEISRFAGRNTYISIDNYPVICNDTVIDTYTLKASGTSVPLFKYSKPIKIVKFAYIRQR